MVANAAGYYPPGYWTVGYWPEGYWPLGPVDTPVKHHSQVEHVLAHEAPLGRALEHRSTTEHVVDVVAEGDRSK